MATYVTPDGRPLLVVQVPILRTGGAADAALCARWQLAPYPGTDGRVAP